jgi:membrane fusion protein (multidrug efflux system)
MAPVPGRTYLGHRASVTLQRMPPSRGHLRLPSAWAALLAACLLASGCRPDAEARGGPPPVTVESLTVQPELLRDVATFNGQLSAENSVMVKSETEGVVAALPFTEGQHVDEGAVLVELRNEEQQARLSEAEANLVLAQEVHRRTQGLAARNAASAAAQDEARAELGVAQARVELARVELARTEIRAPFAGVLGARLVSPGDRIDPDIPLVQLDAVDRLQVSFAISENGILFTRVGAPVGVRVAPYPGEVFPGEVFYVSPTLDPATRRIVAKAWVPNPDGRLRAGLFASVDMEIDERENAILVPESAVVFDRQGTYVWKLLEGDVATRVPVELGLRQKGRVEVTLGLQPGDRIVTAGAHKVSEGKKVVAVAPGASPGGQARREPPGDGGVEEGT